MPRKKSKSTNRRPQRRRRRRCRRCICPPGAADNCCISAGSGSRGDAQRHRHCDERGEELRDEHVARALRFFNRMLDKGAVANDDRRTTPRRSSRWGGGKERVNLSTFLTIFFFFFALDLEEHQYRPPESAGALKNRLFPLSQFPAEAGEEIDPSLREQPATRKERKALLLQTRREKEDQTRTNRKKTVNIHVGAAPASREHRRSCASSWSSTLSGRSPGWRLSTVKRHG